jgi:CheY-like chemotaxis protein/HPt (histidine-containing phosphotransfer) domain-containing protein
LGCQVDLASDGDEGLSLWQLNNYDLVLTDFSMPGMNGFEFASRIRASGRQTAQSVPVVAITGYNDDVSSRCSAAGVTACMSKPFSILDLQRVLDRWLPDFNRHSRECDGALRTVLQNGVGNAGTPAAPDPADHSAIMRSVARTFIETVPEYLRALQDACAVGSRSQIVDAAHKLKSAARLLGGNEVAALCEAVEGTRQSTEIAEVIRLTGSIPDAVRALEKSLKLSLASRESTSRAS